MPVEQDLRDGLARVVADAPPVPDLADGAVRRAATTRRRRRVAAGGAVLAVVAGVAGVVAVPRLVDSMRRPVDATRLAAAYAGPVRDVLVLEDDGIKVYADVDAEPVELEWYHPDQSDERRLVVYSGGIVAGRLGDGVSVVTPEGPKLLTPADGTVIPAVAADQVLVETARVAGRAGGWVELTRFRWDGERIGRHTFRPPDGGPITLRGEVPDGLVVEQTRQRRPDEYVEGYRPVVDTTTDVHVLDLRTGRILRTLGVHRQVVDVSGGRVLLGGPNPCAVGTTCGQEVVDLGAGVTTALPVDVRGDRLSPDGRWVADVRHVPLPGQEGWENTMTSTYEVRVWDVRGKRWSVVPGSRRIGRPEQLQWSAGRLLWLGPADTGTAGPAGSVVAVHVPATGYTRFGRTHVDVDAVIAGALDVRGG